MSQSNRGVTLIELMIAVAIVAVIAAIAIPAYEGYIRDSRLSSMRMNLDTLRIAVEAYRLDDQNGTYGGGSFPQELNAISIYDRFGWKPEGGAGVYSYQVDVTAATTYSLCATLGNGTTSTNTWVRCRKQSGDLTCGEGKNIDEDKTTLSALCP